MHIYLAGLALGDGDADEGEADGEGDGVEEALAKPKGEVSSSFTVGLVICTMPLASGVKAVPAAVLATIGGLVALDLNIWGFCRRKYPPTIPARSRTTIMIFGINLL